jgi:hypothetical protein
MTVSPPIQQVQSLDLSAFWPPGAEQLIMTIEDFVDVWNRAGQTIGRLEIGPNGRLRITNLFTNFLLSIEGSGLGWWQAMGFNTTLFGPNGTATAARDPNGYSIVVPTGAVGESFIDLNNLCTVPNPPTVAPRFFVWGRPAGGFNTGLPWCVGTRYRYTYVLNGVESDWSPPTTVFESETRRDPIFIINRPPGAEIRWYRAKQGQSAQASEDWKDHTPAMEEQDPVSLSATLPGAYYMDPANPCTAIPQPDPPGQPMPNGQFEGVWMTEAGEGVVPWCVPTRYRARYVRGTRQSDWSPYSDRFVSFEFSNPRLTVDPLPTFDVEWETLIDAFITLPRTSIANINQPAGVINVLWRNTNLIGGTINLPHIWPPDEPELTLNVSDFVDAWNIARQRPEALRVPELSVGRQGFLQLTPFQTESGAEPVVLLPISGPWWSAMGFSPDNLFTNTHMVAERYPTSNPNALARMTNSSHQHTNSVMGSPTFIDVNNPCVKPNRPARAPNFVDWNRTFAR